MKVIIRSKKRIIFFFLFIGILIGCNKKYYQSVAAAKEESGLLFVILKTGEKIKINGAKILGNGTIGSINKLRGGNDFKNTDIVAIQNKTAFYKKFKFYADISVKEKNGLTKKTGFNSERFAERYKKGAINTYVYVSTSNYMGSSGASSTMTNFTVFELESTKEFVIYRWNSGPNVTTKIESWISKSTQANKIISDWRSFTGKEKEKYGKDPYEEAVNKYNEDFAAGSLEK